MTWCDRKQSENWVLGASIVQNEINHRPMRNRGNISPYSLYFGKPPSPSYSTVLGKAYSIARTEFGLRLAKKMLETVRSSMPDRIVDQGEVGGMILVGDELWDRCAAQNMSAEQSEDMLHQMWKILLEDYFGIVVDEADEEAFANDDDDIPQDDCQWDPNDLPAYSGNEVQSSTSNVSVTDTCTTTAYVCGSC